MSIIDFGMSRGSFFQECYDKHWFIQRQAFQVGKFNWQDLDNALYSWEPQDRQIRLFKNGPIAPELYTEVYLELSERRTRIIKDALYQYMKDGATLVLNKLQTHSPIIHDYCMTVAQFAGEKANVNAYAAFGGEGSFGKHWDTHDVFALQLIGRKHWKLYPPTFEQPLAHHTSAHHKAECPQEPVFDTILEAGDMLYIPRGWWHEVLPLENEPTLHIAIGTFPPRIIDYLVWLCSNRLPELLEARQSLHPCADAKPALQSVAKTLDALLNDPELLQKFWQVIDEKYRVHSRFRIANLAEQYGQGSSKKPEQFIARLNRFTPIINSQEDLIINGFQLNLDEQSREFIVGLAAEGSLNSKVGDKLYSAKQQQLLSQLGEYDVVEWINR